MGAERENFPSVSPIDHGKLAFVQERANFDIIEIPGNGKGELKTLLGTALSESEPQWSPTANTFVYVGDFNGKREIFRRSYDRSANDEVLVSNGEFEGLTNFLGDPVQSPDGQRIAYTRARGRGHGWQIWVSSIGGAAAQPLVEDTPGSTSLGLFQDLPTWSKDNWIAFNQTQSEGSRQLFKAQVGSPQQPKLLYDDIGPYPCPWSRDGKLLACQTHEGLIVITSEGAKVRVVTERLFLAYDWDRWDKLGTSTINGLRLGGDGHTLELSSINVQTGSERVLRSNVARLPWVALPIRGFSQTSHGTFLTSIAKLQSEIYLFEGLKLPGPFSDWFARLLGRRP
jgi:Tol biopolymer transport system component